MLPHHHHRGSHLTLAILYSLLHFFANFFKKIRIFFHKREHFLPLRFRYVFHLCLQCLLKQKTLEYSHLLFIVSLFILSLLKGRTISSFLALVSSSLSFERYCLLP